jgi:predicted DsbA family dithiol-disulfide isomerase
MMIPASFEYGVPSAGDDAILADILQSLGRDAEHVISVLRTLENQRSQVRHQHQQGLRESAFVGY